MIFCIKMTFYVAMVGLYYATRPEVQWVI